MKLISKFLNEGVEYSEKDYKKFCDFGSNSYSKFVEANPKFNNPEFREYVINNNKADRDSGELEDIALSEIKRLSTEFRRG